MKNVTKCLFVAFIVTCFTSSALAADTLIDAFKGGKVKGSLKAYFFDKDVENSSAKSASILDTAATLNYVTDDFYGFSLGQTFQASASPDADSTAKSVYSKDMYGSGAVLSEAYLRYAIDKTELKLGRQYISTPIVRGSGSRIVKESFSGVTAVNKNIPGTTVTAGYVNEFQGRTGAVMGDDIGDPPSFDKKVILLGISATTAYDFSGAYTIAAVNKSIPNLTLTGQYLKVSDVIVGSNESDIDVYYLEGKYVFPLDNFKLGFGLNYRGSKTDSPLSDTKSYDGTYSAGKIFVSGLGGFGVDFVAAMTSSDDYVIAGLGNAASSYTSTMIRGSSSTLYPDTNSYRINVNYDFSNIGVDGLKGLLQYGWSTQGRVGDAATSADRTSYAGSLTYAIPKVKGLSLSVEYETQEVETTTYADNSKASVDTDELRFRAIYKF